MGEGWPPVTRGRTPSGGHRKGQSTDARHRGGTARSSDEGSVMGSERRGRAGQIEVVVNSVEEEPPQRSKQKVKSFEISKRLVFGAWEKVRCLLYTSPSPRDRTRSR